MGDLIVQCGFKKPSPVYTSDFLSDFRWDFLLLMDVRERISYKSSRCICNLKTVSLYIPSLPPKEQNRTYEIAAMPGAVSNDWSGTILHIFYCGLWL